MTEFIHVFDFVMSHNGLRTNEIAEGNLGEGRMPEAVGALL